jgi:Tol biopolymer transport system component
MLPSPLLLALSLAVVAGEAHAEEAPAEEAPAWDVSAPHGPGTDVRFTVEEGTWLGVDVSPDGKSVIFDLLGDVYEVPFAGGTARALTTGAAWDTDAHYAADGSRIAFTSDRGGSENLWIMGRDGSGAVALTEEKGDRYTDPVWAPEPGWLLGRRRSTDTRSIGVQELWMVHEQGGAGMRITDKEVDPHAGEAAFSPDGRFVWYSTRASRFEYDQDVHEGLWQLVRYDRALAERTVMTNLSEGAVRPTPSPDGRSVAFVSRDRAKTVLMLFDLASGRVRRLADFLDKDAMEAFELRGAYPRMDWTPDSKEVVLWAGGKLWRVNASTLAKAAIPFRAEVNQRITESVHPARRTDRGDVHARVIRWPQRAPSGTVYAAALGRIWSLPESGAARALTAESETAYFPSLSEDGRTLSYVTWSDQLGGQVWSGPPGAASQVTRTPGDYQSPALSPDGKRLAFLRGTGATRTGSDLGAESAYDLVVAPSSGGDGERLRSIPFRGSNNRAPRLQWSPEGDRIYWIEDDYPTPRGHEQTVLKSCDRLGHDIRTHMRVDGAQEIRLSPDLRWVAWKHDHQAWLAPMPALGNETVDAATLPSRKLTELAGDWLDFSGTAVTWNLGDRFFSLDLAGAVKKGATELPIAEERSLRIEVPRAGGKGAVAFINARILTMDEAGEIPRGTLVVRDSQIVALGADVLPPPDAKVIDLHGRTVLPGLVDVHAHLHYASGDVFPEQEWRHLANLAYGVTTVFDPSASTDLVFGQAELIEAGRMTGPRTLSTGFILYGADDTQGAKIESLEDAERHVRRLMRYGAWGVKSYQQPWRSQRQWIVEACRKLGILDVPEGGGDLFGNLGMVVDGHSSIEHALPVAPVYADVKQLWSKSSTTYVPTLLVAYGGVSGEHAFYQQEKVWLDERLTRWVPPDVLMGRAYRTGIYITDEAELHHRAVARDAAELQRWGVNVALGAHGQLQGLGPHWELEALGGPGAMSADRALYAATMGGARHLGLDQDIGSLREGKLADLFVVAGDPLEDLEAARNVDYVMKDGILYDAHTMNRISPDAAPRKKMIWEVAADTMGSNTARPE